MIITRTVLFAAFSSLFLATPALATPPERHTAGVQPCDAEALDGYFEWAAIHEDKSYFPEDAEALPEADEQADPANEAESPDADSEEGEEFAPDAEGCADITLAPYDMLLRPLTEDARPQAVDLRRRVRQPVWKVVIA